MTGSRPRWAPHPGRRADCVHRRRRDRRGKTPRAARPRGPRRQRAPCPRHRRRRPVARRRPRMPRPLDSKSLRNAACSGRRDPYVHGQEPTGARGWRDMLYSPRQEPPRPPDTCRAPLKDRGGRPLLPLLIARPEKFIGGGGEPHDAERRRPRRNVKRGAEPNRVRNRVRVHRGLLG